MTTLGVDVTDKEHVTGWEAIQPNHQPACELVVRLAEERVDEAWKKYDELLDKYHSENPAERTMTFPEYMIAMDKLTQAIEHAKSEHENACTARAAYYQAQTEDQK